MQPVTLLRLCSRRTYLRKPSGNSSLFALQRLNVLSTQHRAMSQFPPTVKAITFAKTGGIEVIEKTEQPFPKQGPGDVILKVCATTMRPLYRH